MHAALQPHDAYFDAQVLLGAAQDVAEGRTPYGQYFLSPLWAAILLTPIAILPREQAAAAFFLTNLGGWSIAIAVSLRMLGWRWGIRLLTMAVALLVFPPVVWSLHGQLVMYLALGLALFLALAQPHPVLAGASLALLTVKPHLGAWPVLLLLLWSARQRRWSAHAGFAAAMAGLLALSLAAQPGWTGEWVAAVQRPPETLQLQWEAFGPTSFYFFRLFLDEQTARLVAVALGAITAGMTLIWLWRTDPLPGLDRLLPVAAATLFFLTPYAQGYDLALLLFPLAFLATLGLRGRVMRPWPLLAVAAVYLFPWVVPFLGWPQPVFFLLPAACLAAWLAVDGRLAGKAVE